MGFLETLASYIAKAIADRITDEVVLVIKTRTKMNEIDNEAKELKAELAMAESDAEREAVLDKVHNLVNGFSRL